MSRHAPAHYRSRFCSFPTEARQMPKPNELYSSDDQVEEVVRRFESCELQPADFNHREHLVVALCYLRRAGDAEALSRLREALGRYVRAHGINPSLYHETITVFWL